MEGLSPSGLIKPTNQTSICTSDLELLSRRLYRSTLHGNLQTLFIAVNMKIRKGNGLWKRKIKFFHDLPLPESFFSSVRYVTIHSHGAVMRLK